MAAAEFSVALDETPFGITFFEGLDIPLVESVTAKGAAANAASKGAHKIKVGDRLIAINGRDVSHFSTPHVLALLAEASWKLRRSNPGEEATDAPPVSLKFRAALVDDNPDGLSQGVLSPDHASAYSQGIRRESSPGPQRGAEASGIPKPPGRRQSSSSVTAGADRAPGRERRHTSSSVASDTGSVVSVDGVTEGGSVDNQLAELENANAAREAEVAREKARLDALREERRKEEAAREERRRQRRAREDKLAEERRRSSALAEEQERVQREMEAERRRLEQGDANGSVSPASQASADRATPVIPAEAVAARPIRRSSASLDRDMGVDDGLDEEEKRRAAREAAAEARRRKNDLSEVAARAKGKPPSSATRRQSQQAPITEDALQAAIAAAAARETEAQKEKQEEELRRLQRSVQKLEQYILQLTQSVMPLHSQVQSPMTGAGSDTASFMSAVDSQAPTPVASERLPVKVVTGNIAAEGGEFIAPTRTVQAQLLQVAQGRVVFPDDRRVKELERLGQNPTPTLFEPAVLAVPKPPPVPTLAYPPQTKAPQYRDITPSKSPARMRMASEPNMRSRSVSPSRVGAPSAFRPQSRGLPSPAHTASVTGSKSARVSSWNRDYIRSRSVTPAPARNNPPVPNRFTRSPSPARHTNFLRRSSVSLVPSTRSASRSRSEAEIDNSELIRQAERRYGPAGAQAVRDMMGARPKGMTPPPRVKRGSQERSPSPSGWETNNSPSQPSIMQAVSPATRFSEAPAQEDNSKARGKRSSAVSKAKSMLRKPSDVQSGRSTLSSRSPSPKPPAAAPVVTLRKIIRATRYAAQSSVSPSLRDVAIKVAEDAFAARNARLKAQKQVEKEAKRAAKDKMVATADSKAAKDELMQRFMPSETAAAPKSRFMRRESDDDGPVTSRTPKSIQSRQPSQASLKSSSSKKSKGRSESEAEKSEEEEEEETENESGSESGEESEGPKSVRSKASSASRKSKAEEVSPVKAPAAVPQPPQQQQQQQQAADSNPSSAPVTVKGRKGGEEKEEDGDEYDEYDEYDEEDEDEEERAAVAPARVLGLWNDSKRTYDVEFRATPFGIKFMPDQKVPVVELVRPEGVAFTVGVIKPGHTMFSVNGKGLVGLSLADAAKVVADAAQKTKASNGSIPCIIRFLKTEVPAQSTDGASTVASPLSSKSGAPTEGPAAGDSKKGKEAADEGKKKSSGGGCCFPRKAAKAGEEAEGKTAKV